MKKIIWKFIFPVTIISQTLFNKWWYVLPVDAPDTMMYGFPLISISEGWHTSGSIQIFILEFSSNFLITFLFWYLLILVIYRKITRLSINKVLSAILLILSGLIICFYVFVASLDENIFKIKRDFDIQILDTGYEFIWQASDRPTLDKYK